MDMIKFKRGFKVDLPPRLDLGEPAFCVDTQELYIGMGADLPPKLVVDPRIGDGFTTDVLTKIANLETTTGDLEISRDELNRICASLTSELEEVKNDLYTKTYTDLIIQNTHLTSVPGNVVSGGYNKALIKGNTLINYVQEGFWGIWNSPDGNSIWSGVYDSSTSVYSFEKNHIGWNSPEIDLLPKGLVKQGAKYTIILDVLQLSQGNDICVLSTSYLEDRETPYSTTIDTLNSLGRKYYVIDGTDIEVPFIKFKVYPDTTPIKPLKVKIMLLEGDWTGSAIQHINGVKSVENPYVKNTNNNLFSNSSMSKQMTWANKGNHASLVTFVPLELGKTYYCNYTYKKSNNIHQHGGSVAVFTFEKPVDTINKWYITHGDGNIIDFASSIDEGANQRVVLNFKVEDPRFKYLAIYSGIATGTEGERTDTYYDMYFGETSEGEVEPKHNLVKPSNNITLRSLPDGTCDTYNQITGEYVKRVDTVNYTGEEAFTLASESNSNTVKIYIGKPNNALRYTSNLYCDKLLPAYINTIIDTNSIYIKDNVDIVLQSSTIGGSTLTHAKNWIKNNNITLCYPLATPEISYIYGGIPQVYENGYIEVGSDTIAPEIEYQLPTSIGSKLDQLTSSVASLQHYTSNLIERGTFTPELYCGTTKCEMHSSTFGRYSKIGNTVTIVGKIHVTDVNSLPTSGSRYLNLRGLPFSQASAGFTLSLSLLKNVNMEDSYQIVGYGYGGQLDLIRFVNGGSYVALTPSQVTNDTLEFNFSMTYFTSEGGM